MKKGLILVVFGYLFIGIGVSMAAEGGLPFYCKEDPSMTKSKLIEGVKSGKLFCLPIAKVAQELGRVTGENIRTRADVLNLIERSDEVLCDWTSGEVGVDYVEQTRDPWKNAAIGTHERVCKSGEKVLKYKGKVVMSLPCGNTLWDRRRQVVEKIIEKRVEIPAKTPPAPKPVEEKKEKDVAVVKEKCIWTHGSNPTPPIESGYFIGLHGSRDGIAVGRSMSLGASHKEGSCQ